MKPFRIGIWIDNDSLPETGGGFSYVQRLIKEINIRQFDSRLEIVFVGINLNYAFNKSVINLGSAKENYYKRKTYNVLHKVMKISVGNDNKMHNDDNIKLLKDNEVQLLFYLAPHVKIKNFPYIITHWDLGHKSTYSFPELSMNNQFQIRESHFSETLSQALLICCESEEGKAEIIRTYSIFPDQIKIFPMFPGMIIEEEIEEVKPEWLKDITSFFIYPAQFWPHKNHYNLLLAFKDFIKDNHKQKYALILSGSDKGNLTYIREVIKEFEIENHVIIPGFITNEELKWLYRNSIGLVFPSFLGPTNMPLLEALSLECNIACSNLKGHKDLLKENAIYFDPTNSNEIKAALEALLEKERPPKNQVQNSLKKELDILEKIFLDAMSLRKTWGQNDNII